MKKTLLYIVVLVALAIGTYFLLKNSKPQPFASADFSITDTASVGKIFLADMPGNTITVSRKPQGWVLNDSLPISLPRLAAVFDFLTNVKPTQQVPAGMLPTVAQGLATNGIKVEVYNLNNEKIRSLFVGGTMDGQAGNYIKVDGLEQVYFYKIPGYESDVFPNVSTELEPWLSKIVYNYAADSIKQVSVYYAIEPDSNFVLSNAKEKINITAKYTSAACNLQKGKNFLKQFEKIGCVGYINNTIGVDSIYNNGVQFGGIVTQLNNGKVDSVQLVYYKADQRAKNPKVFNNVAMDMDYFYARRKRDCFILATNSLTKILSTPSYLIQK